ncbi:MAG: hypothetical protein EOP50_18355 [Sphingobacteriales bacterium]|nr:MAG: hypothetical protein EOP50_18355 [Sphingobacteriales bacterium]
MGNRLVYSGNFEQRELWLETFNDDYLILSYVNGKTGAAGPELFPRDSMVIIGLHNGLVRRVCLKGVLLTISPEWLNGHYQLQQPANIAKGRNLHYAIWDIDLEKRQIKLYTQAHTIIEVTLDSN